jgi:hypothetical protein
MRVIFARPGGLVLSFSGHGLCAFLPWDRASMPVLHNVTTALLPAQIWIFMASSWHAECAFTSEHTFPVGSILAASRGNSQAWLDPGNPGPAPTTPPGCGLPAGRPAAPALAVARWRGGAARPSHGSGARVALPRRSPYSGVAAPCGTWTCLEHGFSPGAMQRSTRTGRARPLVSVCSWAPRFRRLLTRSSPRTWPRAESAGGSVGDAEGRPKQRPATFLHCGGCCPKSLS